MSENDHIQRETAARKVYETYWESYASGDLETFASTLDETYEMIGTSETEVCHTKADGIDFLKGQIEEVVGKVEMRNRQIEVLPVDQLMLVNEHCAIYVLADSVWNFYSKIRISTLLRETETGWKVVQQHGSLPDIRVQEGKTIAIEKISKENLELRDAIKRATTELEYKNRELEIEAALEKVRSASLAMQNSGQIREIVKVVFEKLKELKFAIDGGVFVGTISKNSDYVNYWIGDDHAEYPNSFKIPKYDAPTITDIWDARKSGAEFISKTYSFKEKNIWFEYAFNHTDLKYALPEDFKKWILEQKYLTQSFAMQKNSMIGVHFHHAKTLTENETDILKRFSRVFEQSYVRFLDLQKAEAQAREAQIQLALERVRARTMAMQSSDELAEVSYLLNKQVVELGIPTRGCAFNIYNEHDSTEWFSNLEGTIPAYKTPRENIFLKYYEAGQRGETLLIEEFGGERIKEHYRYLATLFVSGKKNETIHEDVTVVPEYQIDHVAYFKYGYLLFITLGSAQQAHEVFKRFAKEFEQTYTRFLDLKHAESQAREAQIEAALERVRSRSLAMHRSDELEQVAASLFEAIVGLGIDMDGALLFVFDRKKRNITLWVTIVQLTNPVLIDLPYEEKMKDNEIILDYWKATDQGQALSKVYTGEAKNEYFRYVQRHNSSKISEQAKKLLIDLPAWHLSFAAEKNTMLGLDSWSGHLFTESDLNTLRKFARAFEQAYVRFLDLQKAEAQAREAQIQLSLERIRAKAMSMQHSDELSGFLTVLFEQFAVLNLSPVNCHLHFFDIDNNRSTFRLTGKNGSTLIATQEIDLNASPAWKQKVEDLKSGHPKEVDSIYIPYENISEIGEIFKEILEKLPEGECPLPEDYPNGEYITEGYCKYGYLGYSASRPPSDEEKEITRRIANEFGNVYQRFLDLQKAEAQAREAQIENALEKVRSRTMAMQHSNELTDVAGLLFNQVSILGIKTWTTGFNVWSEDNNSYVDYLSFGEGFIEPNTVHTEKAEALRDVSNARKSGVEFDVLYVEGEKLKQLYLALTNWDEKQYEKLLQDGVIPAHQYEHFVFGSKVSLMFITYEPVPEAHDVFKRFAKVFEQTYTRFLDLQKAEAQAREAQIEAALERVRSKAMSMHSSEDLNATIGAFYRELEQFSITPRRCGVGLLQKNRIAELSTMNTIEHGNSIEIIGILKMEGHWVLDGVYDNWILQKEFHPVLRGNEIKEYNQLLRPQVAFPEYPNDSAQFGYFFFFPEGGVYAWTEKEMKEDELNIYRRFTRVLSLTYKRYKDLKDAEANALEAVRRASLDRVRAEIASMRTMNDLQRITPIIWHELTALGVTFVRCGVFIIDEATEHIQVHLSSPDGSALGALDLPFDSSELTLNSVNHWRQGVIFKTHWNKQEFLNFMQSMIKLGQISNPETYQGATQPPESLYLHFVPFKQGMLYVGNTTPLEKEVLELVKSLAESFSIAYARYEDFRQLEVAKSQIEKTFTELKATQAQLIQAEKMASLENLLPVLHTKYKIRSTS
jgi:hypothetical protein